MSGPHSHLNRFITAKTQPASVRPPFQQLQYRGAGPSTFRQQQTPGQPTFRTLFPSQTSAGPSTSASTPPPFRPVFPQPCHPSTGASQIQQRFYESPTNAADKAVEYNEQALPSLNMNTDDLHSLENADLQTPFKGTGAWQSGDATPEMVSLYSQTPREPMTPQAVKNFNQVEPNEGAFAGGPQKKMSNKTGKVSGGGEKQKKKNPKSGKLKKCPLCPSEVPNLIKHQRDYHKITEDVCLLPKNHHVKKPVPRTKQCYHCLTIFEEDHEMISCRKSHGPNRCDYCPKEFQDAYDMQTHHVRDHSMSVQFWCKLPRCERTQRRRPFNNKGMLLQHQIREHNVGATLEGLKKLIKCKTCLQTFKNKRNLEDHTALDSCQAPEDEPNYEEGFDERDDNEGEDDEEGVKEGEDDEEDVTHSQKSAVGF